MLLVAVTFVHAASTHHPLKAGALAQATTYLAAGHTNSTAVFAGGASSADCTSGFLGQVFSVNAMGKTNVIGELKVPRCGLASASVSSVGAVLFAGGNSAHGYTDTVDCFQTAHGGGSKCETKLRKPIRLSSARSWVVGTSSSQKAFFTGGYSAKKFAKSASVDAWDSVTNSMQALAPLPTGGRMFHATTVTEALSVADTATETLLWVGGGTDDNGVTNAVHALGMGAGEKWRSYALKAPRTRLAAATVSLSAANATSSEQLACFMGGEGADGGEPGWTCQGSMCYSNLVECFDSTGSLHATMKLSEGRSRLSAVGVGCKLVVAGGKTTTGFSATVDVLDLCSTTATVTAGSNPVLAEARADVAATVSADGKRVIVVGGLGTNGVSDTIDEIDV